MSNQTSEQALAILDKAAEEGSALACSVKASFSAALQIARVAGTIRNALDPKVVQEAIMPLRNVDFGWRTDKDGYTIEQIRDCWVSAALAGAHPVNNEMNVISGRSYLTLNYFKRKVGTYPGLTDLFVTPGKILTAPGGATVEMTVTYKLHGKDQKVERIGGSAIPVRLNAGMGADGAIGKATRKVLKSVYERLTGSQAFNDGDVDDAADVVVSARIVPDAEVKAEVKSESKPTKTSTVAAQIKKTNPPKTDAEKMADVPPKTAQEVHEGPTVTIDAETQDEREPWESAPEDAEIEPPPQDNPAAAVDELAQVIETQAAAAPAETPASAAKATTRKKPSGGWVKDGSGETKRVGATPEAPKTETAALPPPKTETPPQKANVEIKGLPEDVGDLETTQDAFVGKVTCARDKANPETILYLRVSTQNSTDIWAIMDEALGVAVKTEWIPKGVNGEVATITYRTAKIAGQPVNLIESVA